MSLVYDAVAVGMGAYTRTAFSVQTLRPQALRLEPGTILVVTHRRETDVPLICPSMYRIARLWRNRSPRISFAARDDLFDPGFFAGFPRRLHPRARKALWPLGVGRWLPGIQVHPIRGTTQLRLREVVRAVPGELLERLLGEAARPFRERAARLGLPEPRRAGDVLRGEYADLLWRPVRREELGDLAELDALWRRRAALAAADFRRLVDLVGAGGVLLVFPEGRPSPDGAVGPVRPGLAALVRRGRPRALQPIGIAYDPLTRGRTRAYVSFLEPVEPPGAGVEEAVLALLRLAVPLTFGQVVARRFLAGERSAGELDRAAGEEVERARAEGRNYDPALGDPRRRRARVEEALRATERVPRQELERLAREHASARGEPL